MTETINKDEFLKEDIPVHLRDAQKKAKTLRKQYKLPNKKQRISCGERVLIELVTLDEEKIEGGFVKKKLLINVVL